MRERQILWAIGEIREDYIQEAAPADEELSPDRSRPGRKFGMAVVLIAAILALLGATAVAKPDIGREIRNWIVAEFSGNAEMPVLEEQLEEGQWVYLEGDEIAVIVPQSPVVIVLSQDGGETWTQSVVEGSDEMEFLGKRQEEMQYHGGYIGRFGRSGAYLVLTTGVSMNQQGLRIFLSNDNCRSWREIGNPYDSHISVVTGAGFSTEEIGFISYRYYADQGPDIWWTQDGGETWEELAVTLPEAYCEEGCCFTPESPTFTGPDGVYPITVTGEEATIYLYTHDWGLTWSIEE